MNLEELSSEYNGSHRNNQPFSPIRQCLFTLMVVWLNGFECSFTNQVVVGSSLVVMI